MALTSVPSRGNANPKLVASFPCWTFIVIQVTSANTLYLAETQQQLLTVSDVPGEIDALQISQSNGVLQLWWIGDLYAAGSQVAGATFKPYIGIPGVTTSSGGVGSGIGGYGTSPSMPITPDGGMM